MIGVSNSTASPFCGFYELDTDGNIQYSRIKNNGKFENADPEKVGQNFFDDFFVCQNSEVLRRRFKRFVIEGYSTENFDFSIVQDDRVLPLKIMLVRSSETNGAEHKGLIFVEVRQA
jgi:hypothetical protein